MARITSLVIHNTDNSTVRPRKYASHHPCRDNAAPHLHHPLTIYLEHIMSRRTDMHGFTLVELMIIVAVLSICAAIALPSFGTLIRNNQLESKADELSAFLQFARGRAVINRAHYEIRIDSDVPWEIRKASSADVERILEHNPEQVRILSTPLADDTLIYRPNGTATATTFALCHDADPSTGYLLEVQPSGGIVLHPRGKKTDGTDLESCTP